MNAAILIIEDEYALAAALATVVRRLDATPVVAASGQGGIDKTGTQDFALVILDVGLPDMSGLKVLEKIQSLPKPPPVVVITAHGTLDTALEARRLGAREYFLKPLDLAAVQRTIREVFMPAKVEPAAETTMIGSSDAMQRAFAVIAQASGCDTPVMLKGPPGSGKSLAAQVIHRHSARAREPLVTFRADEWPEDRVEAALDEMITKAGHGVLVLDEAGTFSKPLQAALLHRLGGLKARILSTTSREITEMREDLFYALEVLQVTLPPLSEHTGDIPALAASFLGDHVLSAEALAALKAHAWPGNVRELRAAMTHALAVCGGSTVLPHHLPSSMVKDSDVNHLEDAMKRSLAAWLDQKMTGADETLPSYDDLLETVESAMLGTLLKRFDEKPTRLAAAMKMNRATLRRKLREE